MNNLIDGCPKAGFATDKEAAIIIIEYLKSKIGEKCDYDTLLDFSQFLDNGTLFVNFHELSPPYHILEVSCRKANEETDVHCFYIEEGKLKYQTHKFHKCPLRNY